MIPIVAIRHAPVQHEWRGRFLGGMDVEISDDCRESIDRLRSVAGAWANYEIYSSPLRRALQTAERVFPGRRIVTLDELRERLMGTWEGLVKEEMRLQNPTIFLHNGRLNPRVTAPGGEAIGDFVARVRLALQRLLAISKPAVMVTHNGVILALRSILNGAELEEAFTSAVPHLCPQTFYVNIGAGHSEPLG